jgi:hypothetical protein
MQPLAVDSFAYSSMPGFTRADQEAALKTINMMVLCTYPRSQFDPVFAEDNCRPVADFNEWQGTAAALIKAAYGGNGLPGAVYSDTFVPPNWVGQEALYRGVVAPSCRTCHLLRGTANQQDINFNSFASSFGASSPAGYADRIKVHVFDRGNMPLAKIIFEDFWSSGKADMLATFLDGVGQPVARDSSGAVLRPGRPVADPGPARWIRQGATTLSAAQSLFSTTYSWSVVSGPNGAVPPASFTLTNPGSVQPTFSASANGTYVLRLVTGNGTTQSAPALLTLVVDNGLAQTTPSAVRFAHIKTVLQVTAPCTACHTSPGVPPPFPFSDIPPIFYTDIDRNGDGVVNATDDFWFYTELRGRINFTNIVASPLLRKPSGNHHSGGQLNGFDTSLPPGDPSDGRINYDLFLNWILNGAPFQ